jgi:pyrroloquinoline quinone (PQQ) biosynthesis protein C
MNDRADIFSLINQALEPSATAQRAAAAADGLRSLLEVAYRGDAEAEVASQRALYQLHTGTDTSTAATRRWIAAQAYTVQDRNIPESRLCSSTSSAAELFAAVEAMVAARSRVRHPMSIHMFSGEPTVGEIALFLEHHWLRSSRFYQLVAEFALLREDFADLAILYDNVFEETGSGDASKAHPLLLQRLMAYLNLPSSFSEKAVMIEEQAYLNNRFRCARHEDPAWGYATLYAIEAVTSSNHRSIWQMLRKAGIPEEACEFHRMHGVVDDGHAALMWTSIERHAVSAQFRATFLRSLEHHFRLTDPYFDALWREMQHAGGSPTMGPRDRSADVHAEIGS